MIFRCFDVGRHILIDYLRLSMFCVVLCLMRVVVLLHCNEYISEATTLQTTEQTLRLKMKVLDIVVDQTLVND
jgi:CHASE3 domain sensor protein